MTILKKASSCCLRRRQRFAASFLFFFVFFFFFFPVLEWTESLFVVDRLVTCWRGKAPSGTKTNELLIEINLAINILCVFGYFWIFSPLGHLILFVAYKFYIHICFSQGGSEIPEQVPFKNPDWKFRVIANFLPIISQGKNALTVRQCLEL